MDAQRVQGALGAQEDPVALDPGGVLGEEVQLLGVVLDALALGALHGEDHQADHAGQHGEGVGIEADADAADGDLVHHGADDVDHRLNGGGDDALLGAELAGDGHGGEHAEDGQGGGGDLGQVVQEVIGQGGEGLVDQRGAEGTQGAPETADGEGHPFVGRPSAQTVGGDQGQVDGDEAGAQPLAEAGKDPAEAHAGDDHGELGTGHSALHQLGEHGTGTVVEVGDALVGQQAGPSADGDEHRGAGPQRELERSDNAFHK